jgi:PAS domain S-box-containing protein
MPPSARARRPLPRKKARRPEGAQKALRARLREAEQTIDAIRSGQVDALVLRSPEGETVYALETADRPYRVLVEQMAQGAATLDAAGLILYSNPSLNRLMGVASDALVGTPFASLFSHEVRAEVKRLVAQAGTAPCTLETRLQLDGRLAPVQVSASPLGLEHMAIVALVTDLSDEKEKAALIAAREALQRADRQKDEFLATLAHELRNPLAPIRTAVDLLRTGDPERDKLDYCQDVIARQVGHMARLLDDLLDVSRVSRGKLELRKERVPVAELIRHGTESSHPTIVAGGHHLTTIVAVEPILLDVDPTRLAQVISNLLNNAARYSEPGSRIRLAVDRDGDDAVIQVRDNGVGMRPEMLVRVFEPFFQIDRSLDRSQGGLGIGLTLVKQIVEIHGGTVTAASDGLGKGCEFTVRLPVARGIAMPAAGRPEDEVEVGMTTPRSRILVVDDLRDSTDSLAMMLRAKGHDVRTAYDGYEAVEIALQYRPDVVILDIGMPRLNGYDAARMIREQSGGDSPMLIALTGWGHDENRLRTKEAGFDHHLVKPVEPAVLTKLLAERWEGAQGQR